MAFKSSREEIVGKRFICICGNTKVKRTKTSEWNWRSGIVRAATHRDIRCTDLSVLIEFDGCDWKKREWMRVYDDDYFQAFLIEDTLIWSVNKDTPLGKCVLWPAINYKCLYDKFTLNQHKLKPIEYLVNRRLEFVDYNDIRVHNEVDWPNEIAVKGCPDVQRAIREWTELQDGQRILITTPSVLVGYRVKVYRSEGTTQWYTAVIVSYNENTHELTLMDDTVLEEHNEDPSLVEIKLIGDGVVESILKGEDIGITPRRRACNQNQLNPYIRNRSTVQRTTGVTSNNSSVTPLVSSTVASVSLVSCTTTSTISSPITTAVILNNNSPKILNKSLPLTDSTELASDNNNNNSGITSIPVVEQSALKSGKTKELNDSETSQHSQHSQHWTGSKSRSLAIDERHEPVTVYRDPNLETKQIIRHINSLQHTLMHPVTSAGGAGGGAAGVGGGLSGAAGCVSGGLSGGVGGAAAAKSAPIFPPLQPLQPNNVTQPQLCPSTTASSSSALPPHFSISSKPMHSKTPDLINAIHTPPNAVDPQIYHHMLQGHSIHSTIPGQYNPHHYDQMWRQKNFSQHLSSISPSASWFSDQMRAQLYQDHDRQPQSIRIERERNEEKERQIKAERDKKEQSERRVRQEMLEKEDKERRQREAVQQHFEESLRLAQQKKQSGGGGWSPIVDLPLKAQSNCVPSICNQQSNRSSNVEYNSREIERIPKDALLLNERKNHETERWIAYVQQQHQQKHGNNASQDDRHKNADVRYQHATVNGPSTKTPSVSPIEEQLSQHSMIQRAKGEPSFSLYGYQPSQLSYMTPAQLKENSKISSSGVLGPQPTGNIHKVPPIAHSLEKRESPHTDRSITPNSRNSTPIGRPPSLSPMQQQQQQKMTHEKISPSLYQRNSVGNFKYEYSTSSAPPAHQSSSSPAGLNRVGTQLMSTSCLSVQMPSAGPGLLQEQPQNLVKDNKLRQTLAQNCVKSNVECAKTTPLSLPSAKTSLSVTSPPTGVGYPYSLIQQGLVPNPVYTAASSTHSTTTTSGVTSALSKAPTPKSQGYPQSQVYANHGPGIVSGIPICRSNAIPYYQEMGSRQSISSHPHKYPHPPPQSVTVRSSSINVTDSNSKIIRMPSQLNLSERNLAPAHRPSLSIAPQSPRIISAPVPSPYGPPPGMALPVSTSSSMVLSHATPPAAHTGIQSLNLQHLNNKRKITNLPLSKKQKIKEEPNVQLSPHNSIGSAPKISHESISATITPIHSNVSALPPEINDNKNQIPHSVDIANPPLDSIVNKTSENLFSKHQKAIAVASCSSDVTLGIIPTDGDSLSSNESNNKASNFTPPFSSSHTSNSHPKSIHLKKAWLMRHSDEDKTVDSTTKSGNTPPPKISIDTNATNSGTDKGKGNDDVITNGELKGSDVKDNIDDDETSSASETEKAMTKPKPKKIITGRVATRKRTAEVKEKYNKKRKPIIDTTKSEENAKLGKENDDAKKKEKQNKDIEKTDSNCITRRGRKPKIVKVEEKEKEKTSAKEKSIKKNQKVKSERSAIAELKKSGAPFLQGGSCVEVAQKLPKCRECRMTPTQRNRKPTIFCRFYDYRKLAYKSNVLTIAGFSQPQDASEDDLKLWIPSEEPPKDLDVETAKFLLTHVGDQFCDLVKQEKDAQILHMGNSNKVITWKKVVQGVREMCDVCETTLFNIHWVCDKCGFVVCIDCYKARKIALIKEEPCPSKDRDGFQWLLCNNRQQHEPHKLEVTQIIAASSLSNVGRMLHSVRVKWNIPSNCSCVCKDSPKRSNGLIKQVLSVVKLENKQMNGVNDNNSNKSWEKVNGVNVALIKQESDNTLAEYSSGNGNSPLSFFVDVALTSEKLMSKNVKQENDTKHKKKTKIEKNNDIDDFKDDNDDDNKHSTLRELLMGPTFKCAKDNAANETIGNTENNSKKGNSTPESSLTKKDIGDENLEKNDHKETGQLQHFMRRNNLSLRREVEPLPIINRSLEETKKLYPNVPHNWFCGGRLLVLHDPNNKDNIKLFQEQWKRGQPVIVKDVNKSLNHSLWHPDSFSRDFGDVKNDLVNCKNGEIMSKQPMRKFWDGFENMQNRLKDKDGEYMLLKLKDWPPDEEFSDLLPTRYTDLMNSLPLPEYTNRNGVLNLAGRLPECFVRPDLGPKMYSAYGSALHPDRGTTNLHLDISDAVNVLIYVGIPKNSNKNDKEEAFNAIDAGGCDEITKKRVREKGIKLGALWHIYNARDADKIRDLLNKVAIEKGEILEPHHDPIHDQSWYLDEHLRNRLLKEYGVEGYAIAQTLGDAIFIPAGAPHQVRNLHGCIKVAGDFVSPENVSQCFNLTQEFRQLSDTHTNHEDKLQIKNIIYHAVKDALSCLRNHQPSDNSI